MHFLIHKTPDGGFAVKHGTHEIGYWRDVRKAKAARGGAEAAVNAGQPGGAAVFFALQAASDPQIVAGYNEAEDETFAKCA